MDGRAQLNSKVMPTTEDSPIDRDEGSTDLLLVQHGSIGSLGIGKM
jgi:hypothetical protein